MIFFLEFLISKKRSPWSKTYGSLEINACHAITRKLKIDEKRHFWAVRTLTMYHLERCSTWNDLALGTSHLERRIWNDVALGTLSKETLERCWKVVALGTPTIITCLIIIR